MTNVTIYCNFCLPKGADDDQVVEWMQYISKQRHEISVDNPLIDVELTDIDITIYNAWIDGKLIEI